MRTRREQVQAYRFVIRRVVAALLSGEPEAVEQPMRRLRLSLFASAMVAVIVLAAAGVIGLLTGRSDPLQPNTLVIEESTEARYVYVQDSRGDLRLHPVLNYTSARLILGQPDPQQRRMSAAALRDIPRGPLVGVPYAPDGLPEPDALVDLPWRVCSVPPEVESFPPTATAVIGRELPGGSLLGTRRLYVADTGEDYLLWNDMRLRSTSRTARLLLGIANEAAAIPVAPQLVNTVTAGPDLGGVNIPGAGGQSGFVIAGEEAIVGRVFRTAGQHFVLAREGLVPVGPLTAQIRAEAGVEVRDISTQDANQVLAPENVGLEPDGFPQTVPQPHPVAGAAVTICAVYRGTADGALGTVIEVFDSRPEELALAASQPVDVPQTGQDVVATVDRVLTGGGRGALVQAVPNAGVVPAAATSYLITPDGIRYPLAGEAATALGYGDVAPVAIPATLVEMIPLGPALDPGTAGLPARGAGQVTDPGSG